MAKKKVNQNRVGGKGKAYELRNRLLVLARKVFPDLASYAVLGEVFDMDKTTAEDIFRRDKDLYHL